MERVLVVWCPQLLEEHEDGRAARRLAEVMQRVGAFSPGVVPVRPGACAVATRGPSRYFGGDETLAGRVGLALAAVESCQVGIADGLFAAVVAARSATYGPVVVEPGATSSFLSSLPLDVLGHPELTELLDRLGIRTLGAFAALPRRLVLARFGVEGAHCHAVAGGEEGELLGLRLPLRTAAAAAGPGNGRQPGFWGETAAAVARVELAVAQVVALLGPESVLLGALQGGRSPAERARLVPWSSRQLVEAPAADPWPGRLPPPAPLTVLERPSPVELEDGGGGPVGVSAGGMLHGVPARLSVAGGPWATVAGWAGPWPVDERWWTQRRRRRARMQVVTEDEAAYLIAREQGRWWLEGAYH